MAEKAGSILTKFPGGENISKEISFTAYEEKKREEMLER